eukprot:gene10968-7613_t
MKRGRQGSDAKDYRRYGPAAAAMRKGHTFRDYRQARDQVTAESILEKAVEMNRFYSIGSGTRDGAASASAPSQVLLHNQEELALYRQRKRAEMEVKVTRGATAIGNWIKYARWEAQQGNFERMRSVLERSLPFHDMDPHLWRDYAELEALHGHVEEAREVLRRGVRLLPAAVDLWLKYALLEQAAGDSGERARRVFTEWTGFKDAPGCAFELYVLLEAQQLQLVQRRAPAPGTSSSPSTALTTVAAGAVPSTALSGSASSPLDNIRRIMTRYVETINTPASWLFFNRVERDVLGDAARGVAALKTALQVLPQEVLYGPVECRVPLALADAHSEMGNAEAARDVFHQLLSRVKEPNCAAEVLQRYRRFERRHARSAEDGEYVTFLEARKKYEETLAATPDDYDTALCLVVLLATEQQRLSRLTQAETKETKEEEEEEGQCASPEAAADALQSRLVSVLRDVAHRLPPPAELARSQQHAVLLSAFTQQAVQAYQQKETNSATSTPSDDAASASVLVKEARALLAGTIKQFPFERASCPRLWLDAAALEETVFDNTEQARRLLQAGFQVTKELALSQALLELEGRAYWRGVRQEAEAAAAAAAAAAGGGGEGPETTAAAAAASLLPGYLQRMRSAFQAAIKADPLDAQRWYRYAKWEEGDTSATGSTLKKKKKKNTTTASRPGANFLPPSTAAGRARALMLYRNCAATLAAEAAKPTVSLARRYALLQDVDETWGRAMAIERRQLRRLVRQLAAPAETGAGEETAAAREQHEAVRASAEALETICKDLLTDVVGGYRHEALAWALAARERAGAGVLSGHPPASLPDTLKPAMARLREACDAVVQCLYEEVGPAIHRITRSAAAEDEREEGKLRIRRLFRQQLERERADLLAALLAGTSGSYDDTTLATAWREALLGPLLSEWARYEATVGKSLVEVATAAAKGSAATAGAGGERRRTRLFAKKK